MRTQAAHQIPAVRVSAGPRACQILLVRDAPLRFPGIVRLSAVDDAAGVLTLRTRTTQPWIRQDREPLLVGGNCPRDFGSPRGRPAWGIAIHHYSVNANAQELTKYPGRTTLIRQQRKYCPNRLFGLCATAQNHGEAGKFMRLKAAAVERSRDAGRNAPVPSPCQLWLTKVNVRYRTYNDARLLREFLPGRSVCFAVVDVGGARRAVPMIVRCDELTFGRCPAFVRCVHVVRGRRRGRLSLTWRRTSRH
jgi:hypothetical protein